MSAGFMRRDKQGYFVDRHCTHFRTTLGRREHWEKGLRLAITDELLRCVAEESFVYLSLLLIYRPVFGTFHLYNDANRAAANEIIKCGAESEKMRNLQHAKSMTSDGCERLARW
jgi:hypothetical protein